MSKNSEKYHHFRVNVPAEFNKVFSHFYFAANKSDKTIVKKLLPFYQTILMFSFGNTVLLRSNTGTSIGADKCMVLGPIKKAFDYCLPPGSEIMVVNFKDDAFYRFFGDASLAENSPRHPDELLDESCFMTLWTTLSKIDEATDRVDQLLEFCRPYLKVQDTIAAQLTNFTSNTLHPIKSIADKQQQSERNIQIRHKKYFGYSSKERHRYQRFLKVIQWLDEIAYNGAKISWFEVLEQCGYYDQSQLAHDFRHYINLSPTKYLKLRQTICNPCY